MTTLLGLLVTISTAAGVAAWFAGSGARATEASRAMPVLARHGAGIAVAIAAAQTAIAMATLGPMAGLVIVLSAWMVIGTVFVCAVNVQPARVLRFCVGAGYAGFALLIIAALAHVYA